MTTLQPTPVTIVIIATSRYRQFFLDLAISLRRHFAPELHPRIVLCSDSPPDQHWLDYRLVDRWLVIDHEPWPLVTLHRYRTIMHCARQGLLPRTGYLFYLDVDMVLIADTTLNIFQTVTAVQHPGYYNHHPGAGLPHESRPNNPFYVPPELRARYYAGGFQGGELPVYLRICEQLNAELELAESANQIPTWHDESAWNWYLAHNPPINPLTPEYCYSDRHPHLGLTPRIVAITKQGQYHV